MTLIITESTSGRTWRRERLEARQAARAAENAAACPRGTRRFRSRELPTEAALTQSQIISEDNFHVHCDYQNRVNGSLKICKVWNFMRFRFGCEFRVFGVFMCVCVVRGGSNGRRKCGRPTF